VLIGDTLWAVEAGTAVPRKVVGMATVQGRGLHSPVLSHGSFPIIDGLVASYDTIQSVTLASYGLSPLLHACAATRTCSAVQHAHAWLTGRDLADYIA